MYKRQGGNPASPQLDFRLRGNDEKTPKTTSDDAVVARSHDLPDILPLSS
jgi:hypothetical protein